MQLWQNIKVASGNEAAFPWVVLGFLVMLALLHAFLPAERKRLRVAGTLFLIGLLGLAIAGALLEIFGASNAAYLAVQCCANFLEAVAFINLGSVFLFAGVLRPSRLAPPRIVQDLLVGVAYLIFAIVLLSNNGLDIRGVVATSAVISAIIAFSLQDTLGNIMGGLALQVERTIRPGDWIRVDDVEGCVVEIRWRQTSLETRDWDTVVIPNGALMKAKVTLLGRRTAVPIQRRRWIYFNVDFRCSPTEVINAVETALRSEPMAHVAQEPPPHCLLLDFKESYFAFAARYWLTDLALPDPTDSLVRTRIVTALRRAGIPLSIPAQALFLTQHDEPHRARKQREGQERRVKALRELSFFKTLTPEELASLAGELRDAPFVRGEAMARQGAVAHSLYIIARGEASVHVSIENVSRQVALLQPGDFFGEMGLMTGAPRAATVLAETDMACYRLSAASFEHVLRSRPEIAEHISTTLAQRRVELDQAQNLASAEAQQEKMAHAQGAMLQRIRAFFGL